MITEIALNTREESKGSASLIETVTETDFIMGTVKRINAIPLSELESRVPEFIQKRNENAFVLGGVLERIRREKFWNPGSRHPKNALFERWVEETCHYSGRKARYLISVYVGLVQAAIPSSKISGVGWSKLRLIAPLLKPIDGDSCGDIEENKAHNEQLIRLARRKSRKALESALRFAPINKQLVKSDERLERKPKQYVFKVREEEAHIVDAALEKLEQETGSIGGDALVEMAKAVYGGADTPMLDGHEVFVAKTA